jgi:hypothetical protein
MKNDGRGAVVVRGGKKTYQFFIVTSFFLAVGIDRLIVFVLNMDSLDFLILIPNLCILLLI